MVGEYIFLLNGDRRANEEGVLHRMHAAEGWFFLIFFHISPLNNLYSPADASSASSASPRFRLFVSESSEAATSAVGEAGSAAGSVAGAAASSEGAVASSSFSAMGVYYCWYHYFYSTGLGELRPESWRAPRLVGTSDKR